MSELARVAGVVRRRSEREIDATCDIGLVVVEWHGNTKLVRAKAPPPLRRVAAGFPGCTQCQPHERAPAGR